MAQGPKGTRNQVEVRENIQYSFNANHRETMEALARAKFTNQEFRVVIAVLNETDGRLAQATELTPISWQALTLLSRQNVHGTLQHLVSLNVIASEGPRYRANHPNEWDPKVFRPQQVAKKAIEALHRTFRTEKEKHNFQWLFRLLKSVSNHRRPTGPKSVSNHRRKRLQPQTVPSATTDALGGTIGGGNEKRRDITTPKGVARRKGRAPPDSRVKEILDAMQAEFGFPDKTDIDPIPNYGMEGQHIKRMLTRGFTPDDILSVWRGKVKRRGEFVSMHWVNQDIGKEVTSEKPARDPGTDEGGDFFAGFPDTSEPL